LEFMACREPLALANDLLLHSFKLASDCANVVRSIQREAMGSYSHIIQEIKARAASF
ncbi:hypothetical protein BAE44_0009114, partial [Dichanthelium oligosanthes]